LAPGGSCEITYTFTPSGPGTFNDSSNFTISATANQSAGKDFTVSLTGVGVNPITAVPASHDFGNVNIGVTATRTTVITNPSSQPFGPINMFGGAPTTAEFGASQNCQGNTLAPGGSCEITYTFTPSGPGTFNDSSNFTISATASQSAGKDFSVGLTGCGVQPGQPCGAPPAPPTVTINQAVAQADPTSASTINFTVVFSAGVSGFIAADVSFAASTVGGTLTAVVTGGPATYNVAVSGMTGNGMVVASIPAGVAVDDVGTGNAASTSVDNAVTFVAAIAPTVTPIPTLTEGALVLLVLMVLGVAMLQRRR
jgi:hypothetical protein